MKRTRVSRLQEIILLQPKGVQPLSNKIMTTFKVTGSICSNKLSNRCGSTRVDWYFEHMQTMFMRSEQICTGFKLEIVGSWWQCNSFRFDDTQTKHETIRSKDRILSILGKVSLTSTFDNRTILNKTENPENTRKWHCNKIVYCPRHFTNLHNPYLWSSMVHAEPSTSTWQKSSPRSIDKPSVKPRLTSERVKLYAISRALTSCSRSNITVTKSDVCCQFKDGFSMPGRERFAAGDTLPSCSSCNVLLLLLLLLLLLYFPLESKHRPCPPPHREV